MVQRESKPANASESGAVSIPDYIVGIGASAGGLEALESFFDNMPDDSDVAMVVIQHLSPDYKSLMVELLSKHTPMPVHRAEDGMQVQANHVYLIPPKKNMAIFDGRLLLAEQDNRQGINFPIDIFLNALADDQQEKAICVILSGTGSDGTRGVRAIKDAGGMVMVQDPQTSKFDGMPRSAIGTGLADYVLSAREIPGQLCSYIKHPMAQPDRRADAQQGSDSSAMAVILNLIRQQVDVDFTHYKPNTVIRRIERRMGITQFQKLDDYCQYLQQTPREVSILHRELLIGVTKFFRDTEAFELLEKQVLPELVQANRDERSIRVWIAGCSTGEEAYSVAMLLMEAVGNLPGSPFEIKVFATDVDRNAIEFAGAGVYPESIAADVSTRRLERFFIHQGDCFQIARSVREKVVFASHNLLKDPPFTKIDLISCRNLLIYIQPLVQKKILSLFHFALRPKGVLFLGASETIGDLADHFDPIHTKWKLYRSRGSSRSSLAQSLNMPILTDRTRHPRVELKADHSSSRHDRVLTKVRDRLLNEYVPPCVIVDESDQIFHAFGELDEILRVPDGPFSANLFQLVPRELSVMLSSAIRKARSTRESVKYNNVVLTREGQKHRINIRVQPIDDHGLAGPVVAVFFQPELMPAVDPEAQVVDATMSEDAAGQLADMEQELMHTRENLQATIEELETANEELQATNEELLASNEELQSTNEELHSVNEELYTVNTEYQSKIQELTELNTDLDNLLTSIDIGTIFLDEQLQVRKFNDAVTDYVNLVAQDIGRPLGHLSVNFQEVDLSRRAEQVLADGRQFEQELTPEPGRWLLLRISPYCSDQNDVMGVVVTIVDITRYRRLFVGDEAWDQSADAQ